MGDGLPLLSAGTDSFEEIISRGMPYVDKTGHFGLLQCMGKAILFARPPKFGKSLAVSALEAYFSGKAELFEGLEAQKNLESESFVARPVVRLDMAGAGGCLSEEMLETRLRAILDKAAGYHGVELRDGYAGFMLLELMKKVHAKDPSRQIVLLVDDYDVPVMSLARNRCPDIDDARAIRMWSMLRSFYAMIKSGGMFIHLAFVTGVMRFPRAGTFGVLPNHFTDISLDGSFAALAGFTQEELEAVFTPYVARTAAKLGKGEGEVLDGIREWYRGFSFDGASRVYCPFSIVSFLAAGGGFGSFWADSSSASALAGYLLGMGVDPGRLAGAAFDRMAARVPEHVHGESPLELLYQTGYLTLRKDPQYDVLSLDYPNREARVSLNGAFFGNLVPYDGYAELIRDGLRGSLEAGDVEGTVRWLAIALAGIPRAGEEAGQAGGGAGLADDGSARAGYDSGKARLDRLLLRLTGVRAGCGSSGPGRAREVSELASGLWLAYGDGFRSVALSSLLLSVGAVTQQGMLVGLGYTDIAVNFGGTAHVTALRVAAGARALKKAAGSGLDRIRAAAAAWGRTDPVLISLAVDRGTGDVGACAFESRGRRRALDIAGLAGPGPD